MPIDTTELTMNLHLRDNTPFKCNNAGANNHWLWIGDPTLVTMFLTDLAAINMIHALSTYLTRDKTPPKPEPTKEATPDPDNVNL